MENSPQNDRALFVWRGTKHIHHSHPTYLEFHRFYRCGNGCPFCSTQVREIPDSHEKWPCSRGSLQCPTCGFNYSYSEEDPDSPEEQYWYSTLRELSINQAGLGFDELATHVRRKPEDLYFLQPRRFEELIADVFKTLGYAARLTKTSRDGGVDIMLLEANSEQQVLVQCKRYAPDRKVGVAAVRELLGVQIKTGVPHAIIVTTSSFTGCASSFASAPNKFVDGLKMELVDCARLLEAMGVYNTLLPPLDSLNLGEFVRDRQKWIGREC
jgi:hypothetical protein